MALPQIGHQSPVVFHRSLFSDLRPVLLIKYINDIDVGLNNFISKFADDTKIGNSIVDGRYRLNLQEDLRNISQWSDRWEIPFNVNKYHILHVGTKNQKFDYEMNGVKLDSVQCVKDLDVSIALNLKYSQQCKDAASKANAEIYKQLFFLQG